MTKEKLLEWGLTEEQATKVMEGLNGSFVTKARFNEVNTELTTAKNTIKERDTQLETLKKASGDTKALQDQITQLQADNKKKDTDHAAELKNLKISNAVELALTGAKAKNNTAVKALLVDFIGMKQSFPGCFRRRFPSMAIWTPVKVRWFGAVTPPPPWNCRTFILPLIRC